MKNTLSISFANIEVGGHVQALAAFVPAQKSIWKEDSKSEQIKPQKIKDGWEYIPWGMDNQMPYEILEKIEADETINTCQQHNIKNCYAAGLEYVLPKGVSDQVKKDVKRFCRTNDLTYYHLGMCTDMKFWQFAVTLFTINKKGTSIAAIRRLEAIYCRFSKDEGPGQRRYVYYGDFRSVNVPKPEDVQRYPMLDMRDPFTDLEELIRANKGRKEQFLQFAMVTRIPTPDNTYYPIPYYASLFKGKWYDIKQLIALGKYSKLKNAAPLKYIITIDEEFWDKLFEEAGATSDEAKKKLVDEKKEEMINFMTGAENSGRVLFSGAYLDPSTGKPNPYITITNLEHDKEGGDWATDNVEAINMVCFVMGVHSNLVGSVPGKTQSNNSGSDKRELYMIAQLLNRPTHDLLKRPHNLVCYINQWEDVEPECKIMQLTTLDEHKDVKQTDDKGKEQDHGSDQGQ